MRGARAGDAPATTAAGRMSRRVVIVGTAGLLPGLTTAAVDLQAF